MRDWQGNQRLTPAIREQIEAAGDTSAGLVKLLIDVEAHMRSHQNALGFRDAIDIVAAWRDLAEVG